MCKIQWQNKEVSKYLEAPGLPIIPSYYGVELGELRNGR